MKTKCCTNVCNQGRDCVVRAPYKRAEDYQLADDVEMDFRMSVLTETIIVVVILAVALSVMVLALQIPDQWVTRLVLDWWGV